MPGPAVPCSCTPSTAGGLGTSPGRRLFPVGLPPSLLRPTLSPPPHALSSKTTCPTHPEHREGLSESSLETGQRSLRLRSCLLLSTRLYKKGPQSCRPGGRRGAAPGRPQPKETLAVWAARGSLGTEAIPTPEQGCQGPDGKYCRLRGPYRVCSKSSLLPLRAARESTHMNALGCVPTNFYVWTLTFECR